MKNNNMEFTPICDKCGKVAPINKEKSSVNWTAYKIGQKCKCGGNFKQKCLIEQGRGKP